MAFSNLFKKGEGGGGCLKSPRNGNENAILPMTMDISNSSNHSEQQSQPQQSQQAESSSAITGGYSVTAPEASNAVAIHNETNDNNHDTNPTNPNDMDGNHETNDKYAVFEYQDEGEIELCNSAHLYNNNNNSRDDIIAMMNEAANDEQHSTKPKFNIVSKLPFHKKKTHIEDTNHGGNHGNGGVNDVGGGETQYQLYSGDQPTEEVGKSKWRFFKWGRLKKQNNKNKRNNNNSSDADAINNENNNNNNNSNSNSNQNKQKHILHELFHWYIHRSLMKKILTALVGLTSIAVIADAFVFQTGYVQRFLSDFLDWMRVHDGVCVWGYILMLVLTSLIFIPPSILIFASGFIFRDIYGPAWGIPIALLSSYIASIIGGTIGFFRANYMTRDLIQILMRRYPILRAVDRAIVRNSLRVMILMRLNCLIPFGVINYAFGITGVNWAVFVLGMVGVLPWHLYLIYLGSSANSVYNEDTETSLMAIILMSMGAAFGVIGLVITWKFAKKELQKEVDSSPTQPTIDEYRNTNEQIQQPIVLHHSSSIENSDLYFTDYVLMQYLGESPEEGEQESEEDYQSKLGWTEIILDDFS